MLRSGGYLEVHSSYLVGLIIRRETLGRRNEIGGNFCSGRRGGRCVGEGHFGKQLIEILVHVQWLRVYTQCVHFSKCLKSCEVGLPCVLDSSAR